jgi:hypothetical protein
MSSRQLLVVLYHLASHWVMGFYGMAEWPMTLSRRLLWGGFSAAILSGCIPAQSLPSPAPSNAENPEKTIEGRLLSEDPRLMAWGAHDALVAGDRTLVPDLLSLASQWVPPPGQGTDASNKPNLSNEQLDKRDAMAAVVDALIQMDVPIPPETLRNLAPDFPNAVAVILSRMPIGESESLTFDFYRSPAEHRYGLQYVSAALLALHPVTGFTADLVSNIDVRITIRTVLPGSSAGGGRCAGAFGVPSPRPHKGWPAIGQYALSKKKSDGAWMLVTGIDPIYAIRTESSSFLEDCCGRSVYMGSEERLRLIAQMLGVDPETIPWHAEFAQNIEFQSLGQFDRAVLVLVASEQNKQRATVAALAQRGLLTSAEAQDSLPELHLTLNDMRGPDKVEIGDIPNLPSHAGWSNSP